MVMRRKGPVVIASCLTALWMVALAAKRERARAEEMLMKECWKAARDFSSPLFSIVSIKTSNTNHHTGIMQQQKSEMRARAVGGLLN